MAHLTASVEYALHGLLWLVDSDGSLSTREIAEIQGVSPSFLAKIFPRLEKAGIVSANDGVRGGYRLARPVDQITFLDVVDAVEGHKPLFDCQEVRERCALFGGNPPSWATNGTCAIHAVMIQAEKAMREVLATQTLSAVSERFSRKAPDTYMADVREWFSDRHDRRTAGSGRPRREDTS